MQTFLMSVIFFITAAASAAPYIGKKEQIKEFKISAISIESALKTTPKLKKSKRAKFTNQLIAQAKAKNPKNKGDRHIASVNTGALVGVKLQSSVGILLDEFQAAQRTRVRAAYMAKPADFWLKRAEQQVETTKYRLVYRNLYYSNKGQLPLPPNEQWNLTVGYPYVATIDGHELVMVDYEFTSILLSSVEQVALSDRNLSTVGASVTEAFVLPADPEHLFERTGYSCMDEEDFPPNSVDSENSLSFYDDTCNGGKSFCHVTLPYPKDSCSTALKSNVGRVPAAVQFTRLTWDAALADQVRVGTANPAGADLEVLKDGLVNNRVIYRYFPANSCAIVEGCVGGSGWRRLLQFDASVANRGSQPVHLGDVSSSSPAAQHNMIEYSDCHKHYHFSHYGKFVYGNGKLRDGSKRAFCLESTSRYSNNEDTPLTHPYSCNYQGIEAGWGDDYIAGIECQWIDITALDTSKNATTDNLSFQSNGDQFLCEGTPKLDTNGNPLFVPTTFKTEDGKTVDRIDCNFAPNYEQNNFQSIRVNVPQSGNTYVTGQCKRGQNSAVRNCGLTYQSTLLNCQPGSAVKVSCSLPSGDPQFVRICEASRGLKSGMGCTYRDALNNGLVTGSNVVFNVACPAKRDSVETGGVISVYSAPHFADDSYVPVNCKIQ